MVGETERMGGGMKFLTGLTLGAFCASAAYADLAAVRAAVVEGDGHAVLDPEYVPNLPQIAEALAAAGDVRVGVSVYGGILPEAIAAREAALDLFEWHGFTVCKGWGSDAYDFAPEDMQLMFHKRYGETANAAGEASLKIDNGAITQAGNEYGQDYLVVGVGKGEDRLFVKLEAEGREVCDDRAFAAVDLMIDGESLGSGTWDCVKGRP